jgi:putative oxidoreductase
MTSPRVIARPMLASMFVVGGTNAVKNPERVAIRAKPVIDRIVPLLQRATPGVSLPDNPATWVRINGAAQLAGAAMLATGRFPRLAALGLTASLVPTTLAGHPFWQEQDPAARATQRTQFFKNVSMAGGLLMAALDRPSKKRRKKKSDQDAG